MQPPYTDILKLTPEDQERLENLILSGSQDMIERAGIIKLRSEGCSRAQICRRFNCSPKRVSKWVTRFTKIGVPGLEDLPKGRPPRRPTQPAPVTSIPTLTSVNMHMVAKEAGVSKMTVSRVFANHPYVAPQIRDRVFDAARMTGYRPDPEVRKLMAHLRQRKLHKLQGMICSLEAHSWQERADGYTETYFRSLIESARKRAESLGFGWEPVALEDFLKNPARVSRMLYHRGVEGIFLPPPPIPLGHDTSIAIQDAGWHRFSVITATHAIHSLPVRRVVPDHFRNVSQICGKLTEYGYQTIGLAIPDGLDERARGHYSGAYAAFHLRQRRKMPGPFLYGKIWSRSDLVEWWKTNKLDAIIVGSGFTAQNLLQRHGFDRTGYPALAAVTMLYPSIAGIDELPGKIGATAIETLSSMITQNEKWPPSQPITTMVAGNWIDADSAPRQGAG